MRRSARLLLVALAAWCGGPLAPSAPDAHAKDPDKDGPAWPFGEVVATATAPPKGLDLYNLGILGAKARDADLEPAAGPEGTGVRQVAPLADPAAADEGPRRLRVEMLFPGGPADRAGLRIGDVVLGVGDVRFGTGSLAVLARAIVEAESAPAGKGAVTLLVERARAKGPLTIAVPVPSGGVEAATPLEGKARDAMIAAASKWLAKRQQSDGGFPETYSGGNGAVVQAAVAGLAWLAEGSDLSKGPRRENVKKAADFVAARAGIEDLPPGVGNQPGAAPGARARGENWSQVNWALAYGAIFLGELHARTPTRDVEKALHRCGAALAKNQEASGGWAHGPGGPNGLGYVELNIVSGLALGGLGVARRGGFAVPEETLRKAEDYIVASSGEDGGVGYSTTPGHRGMGNIGRTAGAWLGCASLGTHGTSWGKRLESYVTARAGAIYDGHACLMQHHTLAGVAAQAIGGDARKAFWATSERDLILARAPDGSFQPRPWHESVAAGMNTDVGFGEVWTTASWVVVLASEPAEGGRPGLPAWTGRLPPARRKK